MREHAEAVLIAYSVAALCFNLLLLANGSIALAIAFPLLAFAGIEGLYRLVFFIAYGKNYKYSYTPYLFQDHPQYGNALRPGTDTKRVRHLLFDKYIFRSLPPPVDTVEANIEARFSMRVNILGYRGVDFNREKTGRLRIFCSGGSTTACYGDDEQAWPVQLERALASAGMPVEVINGGVWGWTSTEELKRLSREIEVINPDVVLLHQGWNEEFLHSALRLGNDWKPGTLRTLAERELCVPPGSMLARLPLVSTYMLGLTRRRRYFELHMAFTNHHRWLSLLDIRYVRAWMENLVSFGRLAIEHGFILYTVNPPCLVSMDDDRKDRDLYVGNSRLTPLHANYQAVSKQRIAQALRVSSRVVPCLDVEALFKAMRGDARLELFRDEIHLTPMGDAMLAGHVASLLSGDGAFCSRYEGHGRTSNVDIEALEMDDWQIQASLVTPYVGRFVTSLIRDMKKGVRAGGSDVPDNMYTTY